MSVISMGPEMYSQHFFNIFITLIIFVEFQWCLLLRVNRKQPLFVANTSKVTYIQRPAKPQVNGSHFIGSVTYYTLVSTFSVFVVPAWLRPSSLKCLCTKLQPCKYWYLDTILFSFFRRLWKEYFSWGNITDVYILSLHPVLKITQRR